MRQGSETASREIGQIAVLILGMHRSGTSLLSSLVQSLGVSIGEHLLPADMHNLAGYYEDRECVDIQERMLLALGQPWHGENGMLPFPSEWWRDPALLPLVGELEAWVNNRRSFLDPVWAVKDPRTTRFLPLWQELLKTRGITPRYLLAVRNPAEVVASQVKRESVPAGRLYHTWLRYNMEALLHGGADIAGVFVYSQWFSDGVAQLRRLAAILGMNINDDECDTILGRLLNSELHRQSGAADSSPNWASHLYTHLERLSDQQNLTSIPGLAAEAEYFDAALRQGQEPETEGALTAVLTSTTGLPEAVRLAHRLRGDGARLVLSVDKEVSTGNTGGLAVVVREINGPPIEGRPQACAAYAVWRWLQPRAFVAVHIEGGAGLSVHALDTRRQGWRDQHGPIHVHYFTRPPWLNECGYIHFHNMREAEAWCLERRVIVSNGCLLHAHPTLRAMLHNVAVDEPECSTTPIPADQVAPLVSICITHFNRPGLLADCLASVRHQIYANIEVILVDDGSTQPAAQVFLDSLEDEFRAKGWTLIRQENRYLGAARNAAARAAKGDYLFFLDDDNLLLRDGIENAVRIARHTNADIVTSVMAMFHGPAGTDPMWPDKLQVFLGGAPLFGLFNNTLGDANALVRRSCWGEIGGYTEDRGTGTQDWELYATATLRGYRLETSLDPLSWYRVSASGMAQTGDWWADYRLALRAYEAVLPPALRELPALAGALWRQANETENKTRNLEAELASRDHYLVELRDQARHLETELAVRDRYLAELGEHGRRIEAELATRDRQLTELADHKQQIETELLARDRDLVEARGHLAEAATTERKLVEHVCQARATLVEAENRATDAEQRARRSEAENGELRSRLNSVLESTSWQVTWPLRRALDGHPRTARAMRRAAKLAWWTVTLQLPGRIASSRRKVEAPTASVLSLPNPNPDDLKETRMGLAQTSSAVVSFTAHNIRLDDGTQTKPERGFTFDEHPIFVSAKRLLSVIFPKDRSNVRLVDLGCGEGGFAVEFARMGFNVVGIEVRDLNIAACFYVKERTNLPNLMFVRDDAWNLPKYGIFDIVFCRGLLYHMDQPAKFLRLLSAATSRMLILDTHFATDEPNPKFHLSELGQNEGYIGRWQVEFEDEMAFQSRDGARWSSWDNRKSFWLKRECVLQAIVDSGFDVCLEQFDSLGNIPASIESGFYKTDTRSMFIGIKSNSGRPF